MNHASLFSGIGGFDLAAEWMGWINIFQCDNDPFCQSVLRHHFPSAHLYGDIRDIDGTQWNGQVDILTGGFPCQPFSAAGRRRGTEDDRFLWPEMLRVIREVQPTWIVAENVRGLLSIDGGMVFERVCSEMEANGYEVQPLCIPACAVGAPHRRERLWFVAHRRGERRQQDTSGASSDEGADGRRTESHHVAASKNQKPFCEWCDINAADTIQQGLEGQAQGIERREEHQQHDGGSVRAGLESGDRTWNEPWIQAATRLCVFHDGFLEWMDCCSRRIITPLNHYADAIKTFTAEDMLALWRAIQSQDVWQPPRGCDKVQQQDILLEILCRIQREHSEEFSRKASRTSEAEDVLRGMWSEGLFGYSPQERELAGQQGREFAGALSSLPHEIALAIMEAYKGFPKWRKESLKAYGNAIVPQVAYRIFQSLH